MACVAVCISMFAAGCNVDEGSTTEQTLAPLGTPSNTVPATHDHDRRLDGRADLDQHDRPSLRGVRVLATRCHCRGHVRDRNPPVQRQSGQRHHELPQRTDPRQRRTISMVAGRRSCVAELGDGVRRDPSTAQRVFLDERSSDMVVSDGHGVDRAGSRRQPPALAHCRPTRDSHRHQLPRAHRHRRLPSRRQEHLRRRTGERRHRGTVRCGKSRRESPPDRGARSTHYGHHRDQAGPVGFARSTSSTITARERFTCTRSTCRHSTLTDVTQTVEPIAKLTVGSAASAPIAWRLGACTGLTRTQQFNSVAVVDQPAAFAALSTEPLGWLDPQQLVLSVRATGCTGPSDLWIWNIVSSAATPLVTGVDTAAIRSVLAAFGELPGDINNAAPG